MESPVGSAPRFLLEIHPAPTARSGMYDRWTAL